MDREPGTTIAFPHDMLEAHREALPSIVAGESLSLVIGVRERELWLPPAEIDGVARLERITKIPRAPRALVGLAGLHSRVFPVWDIGGLLGAPGKNDDLGWVLLLEAHGEKVGFAFERLPGLFAMSGSEADRLEPAGLLAEAERRLGARPVPGGNGEGS